ncbi:AKT-interacting protein [Armadillidium nasatum]|uniref:AKT-interacting protein n=1 Tax=Armadillidium nasatum TaxID=96803 RepID=A0A5N5T5D5_9CRUS|nr:AKT-interacting protein [Armadillidium nasatum]
MSFINDILKNVRLLLENIRNTFNVIFILKLNYLSRTSSAPFPSFIFSVGIDIIESNYQGLEFFRYKILRILFHILPILISNDCLKAPISNLKLTDTGGPDTDRRMNTDIFPSEESTISRNSSSRGSYRKVLPSLPDMDQQLNNAAKMIDSRTSTKKGNHSYKPYFLEYTLLAEYNLLQKQRVAGVYVIPSANSPIVWFGVIFIRQGLYQGGIFRFALHIPENYPDGDVPSVFFETPVFHPLVDPETGELEVKKGFSNKWRRNVHHLWHVLLYLRRIFYKIETVNPLNPEAAGIV